MEGENTVVAAASQTEDSIRINLQQKDVESRTLPPIDVLRFDGDPRKWPEFIDDLKTRVHMKVTFNDSMQMERLHSVLYGDEKKAVGSIGTYSIFYAAALKTLKREFGPPIVVANLKLKALFDQPQIHSRDRVALQNYHEQLKCTTTWFTPMDYQSTICSTKNLTKAVKRLPEILRKSFYKATKDVSFASGDVTLIKFKRWLDNRLKEYFNPIANITAKQEEKPKVPPHKANTNAGTIKGKFTDKQNSLLVMQSTTQAYGVRKII